VEFKVFGKWDINGIEIRDLGIKEYVNLTPKLVPHSCGRHSKKMLRKNSISIVERLINKVMLTEKNTGKKGLAFKIVRNAFDIVNRKTKKNPVEVLIEAIINASPREETTRVSYGGIIYHKSVDVSPQRRVDLALSFIVRGAWKASFKTKKSIEEALADEIIAAANYNMSAFSISRKEEIERIAKSSR